MGSSMDPATDDDVRDALLSWPARPDIQLSVAKLIVSMEEVLDRATTNEEKLFACDYFILASMVDNAIRGHLAPLALSGNSAVTLALNSAMRAFKWQERSVIPRVRAEDIADRPWET